MATQLQRERLRGDLDANEDALSDAEIDDVFARAEAQYGDYAGENVAAVEAQARVIAIQQLLAGAAKRADTSQNASSERRSQVFEHLMRLRRLYTDEVSAALGTPVQWAGLRRTDARAEEYPNA